MKSLKNIPWKVHVPFANRDSAGANSKSCFSPTPTASPSLLKEIFL